MSNAQSPIRDFGIVDPLAAADRADGLAGEGFVLVKPWRRAFFDHHASTWQIVSGTGCFI